MLSCELSLLEHAGTASTEMMATARTVIVLKHSLIANKFDYTNITKTYKDVINIVPKYYDFVMF